MSHMSGVCLQEEGEVGGRGEHEVRLKASYTSSLRPHTLVAEGRIH
jgi:hypothetical protein